MSAPVPANNYSVAFGTSSTMVPVVSTVAPASTSLLGPSGPFHIGQMWVNSSANTVYILTSLSSAGGILSATWTIIT